MLDLILMTTDPQTRKQHPVLQDPHFYDFLQKLLHHFSAGDSHHHKWSHPYLAILEGKLLVYFENNIPKALEIWNRAHLSQSDPSNLSANHLALAKLKLELSKFENNIQLRETLQKQAVELFRSLDINRYAET